MADPPSGRLLRATAPRQTCAATLTGFGGLGRSSSSDIARKKDLQSFGLRDQHVNSPR
jgi:hypothetical protein